MNDKIIAELREKAFTAIGEASMCWIPTPQGIFDSTRAQGVGNKLMEEILSRAEQEAKEEPLTKIYNSDLLTALKKGEEIISGLEAQADNLGIDLDEARNWWANIAGPAITKAEEKTK